jgi:hypothetical protein
MQVRFWHTFWMAGTGDLELLCWFRWTRRILCSVGMATVLSGVALIAQDTPNPQGEPIHTLHVYTNVLQIPTLVLGPNRERIKTPIVQSRFSVSIDTGPWFRATHVRQEGNDPISLSILLDVSGASENLMPKMAETIAGLAPLSLHPKDHVSIYALDCSLVRSLNDWPADGANLKVGVEKALESWMERREEKQKPDCSQRAHLWDAIGHLAVELSNLPGRRVILAVSEGKDDGSTRTWNEVRAYAQSAGVAIFGLTYVPSYAQDTGRAFRRWSTEDPFHLLCELSGGMVFLSSTRSLESSLTTFTTTVRERYIVEFPRPSNATSGEHGMQVKIAKGDLDFVRSAGISVPIPDPALLTDPTTVSVGPQQAPEIGNRHTMSKPQ